MISTSYPTQHGECMQREVALRDAGAADFERVVSIYSEAFGATAPDTAQWEALIRRKHSKTVVATDAGEVVGVGTLFVMEKMLRDGRNSGLIEDVAVDARARGIGVGHLLIENLVGEAQRRGCYKVILNCTEENVPFYEKSGFRKREVQMRRNLD